jgi:transcriptional regulator of acetoin/glycerol metabolism
MEKNLVQYALMQNDGNVSAAARLLGIDRLALQRRIEKHNIAQ